MCVFVEMLDFPKSSVAALIHVMANVEFSKRHNHPTREVLEYEHQAKTFARRVKDRVIRLAMIQLAGDRPAQYELSNATKGGKR